VIARAVLSNKPRDSPNNTVFNDTALNQQSTYGYDEFNRLTSQTVTLGPVQNYTYAYDRYGNRWQQNALQVGPSPQLSFDTSTNRVAGYSYDAAGNVLSDGINTYQYDAEGNLIQETSGSSIRYSYNALNQQVRTDASWGATENVFNLAGQIASLWYSNGNPIMGKAYWGSTPIESYIASKDMAYFQHRDWLGSLRLETNGTGAVIDTRTSLVFGDGAANASGNRDNSFDGYTGLWDGASSATNHAQYREYSNILGRWLQPDPYDGSYHPNNPQSFNRYSYVQNRPLSATDPAGMDDCADCSYGDSGGGGGGGDGTPPVYTPTGTDCNNPLVTCVTTPSDPPVGTDPGGCIGSCGAQPVQNVPGVTGGGGDGQAPSNPTQPTACQVKTLDAINSQFGTNLTAANILPTSDPNPTAGGGQINTNFGVVSGLSPGQFNAIQAGRFAPSGVFGFLTGYGSSLHVVAGPSSLDPPLIFSELPT